MAKTASENVQDDLIAEQMAGERVTGGLVNQINSVMDRLSRELKTLTLDVDVAGTQNRDVRKRRMKLMDERSRELVATAYREINTLTRQEMIEMAKTESMAVADALEENIP